MGRINSKNKGNIYERKIAKEMGNYWGAVFNRSPGSGSYRGSREAELTGDLVTDPADKFPFSLEAKNRQTGDWTLESIVLNKHDVMNWWAQSVGDAERSGNLAPMLVFTRNYADDFVMIPFESETFAKILNYNQPGMVTVVTYEDEMKEEVHSYLVIVTTLEGFMAIEKQHYIDTYLDNNNWKNTQIYTEGREDETVREAASSILDQMFGD